jgi:hypothetical protein
MSRIKYHSSMMNTLKGLGRHEQWSRYMMGGRYEDAITIGKYTVEAREDERDHRFFLWAPKNVCVNMVIDKQNKTAIIDAIQFDSGCTIHETMKRGEGTREMVDFCVHMLKQHGATSVSLSDNSSIDCNGTDIELGRMYFLKYGMTWYEKYFGFQPAERFAKAYENAKRQRKEKLDVKMLASQPCEFFTVDTVDSFFDDIQFKNFHRYEWVKDL